MILTIKQFTFIMIVQKKYWHTKILW